MAEDNAKDRKDSRRRREDKDKTDKAEERDRTVSVNAAKNEKHGGDGSRRGREASKSDVVPSPEGATNKVLEPVGSVKNTSVDQTSAQIAASGSGGVGGHSLSADSSAVADSLMQLFTQKVDAAVSSLSSIFDEKLAGLTAQKKRRRSESPSSEEDGGHNRSSGVESELSSDEQESDGSYSVEAAEKHAVRSPGEDSRRNGHNSQLRKESKRMRCETKPPLHAISESEADGTESVDLDTFLNEFKHGKASKAAASQSDSSVSMVDQKIARMADICEQASEVTSEDLNERLATVYNPLLRKKPNDEAVAKIIKSHPRPGNMNNLIVPKTNPGVFSELRKGVQLVDASAQFIQELLSKAMTPNLRLVSKIASLTKEECPKVLLADHFDEIADTLKLTTAAFSLMHQLRKDIVRNNIHSPVASLCNWKHDVGETLLFGETWVKDLQTKSGESESMHFSEKFQALNANCKPLECAYFSGKFQALNDDVKPIPSEKCIVHACSDNFTEEAKQLAKVKSYGGASFSDVKKQYSGYTKQSSGYTKHDSKKKTYKDFNKKGKKGETEYKKPYYKNKSKKGHKDKGESEVCVNASNASTALKTQDSSQECVSNCFSKLENTSENFRGGKIASCMSEWQNLTSDPWILNVVSGYQLDLESEPCQTYIPHPLKLSHDEQKALDEEILHFIKTGIVEDCPFNERGSGFYSNLFTRPKEDGSKRVILNLQELTSCLEKEHFKMETVRDVILMMRENCNFASIDFKHAFYSIKVHEESRKYLRFIWRGRHLQFTCMAQGLGPASRVFTKLMKPVLSHLRSRGIEISVYIDDSITIDDFDSVTHEVDVDYAILKFDSLGYTINVIKSVIPSLGIRHKEIKHLGFIFNSILMTVRLTEKKQEKIASMAAELLTSSQITILDLASFVGKLVAVEPGFPYAPVHYKQIEIFKNEQLRLSKGNMHATVHLPEELKSTVLWWKNNIFHVCRHVIVPKPSHYIESDSSGYAWGGCLDGLSKARGSWSSEEMAQHINLKELTAAYFMLKTYCKDMRQTHIRLKIDNTTAVSCVQRRASVKPKLMNVTRQIFLWALERDLIISAEYLPGRLNQVADAESRCVDNTDSEWMLESDVFRKLCTRFGQPDIDIFASRLNAQLDKYISWRPDPDAIAIDAFSQDWSTFDLPYLFPPFSVIARTLAQARRTTIQRALLIIPMWPTQPWWPAALRMAVAQPVILPRHCLWLPQDAERQHPMRTLQMAALCISGDLSRSKDYQKTLYKSSAAHGERVPMHNIGAISKDGANFALRGKLMNFALL